MNAALRPAIDAAVFATAVATAIVLLAGLRWLVARHRRRFTAAIGAELADAFVFVAPERLWRLSMAIAAAAAAVALLSGASALVAASAAAVAGWAPRLVVHGVLRRRRARLRAQLPDALMLVAASLRSGHGLTQAIAATVEQADAPISQEFELLLRGSRVGTSIEEGIARLARRHPLEELVLLRAAVGVSARAGGGLAEALDALAVVLRSTLAIEAKVDALTAQGRLQALVMAALPPLLALLLLRIDPDAMAALLGTATGRATLVAVAVLDLLGYVWIRRIVRIDP